MGFFKLNKLLDVKPRSAKEKNPDRSLILIHQKTFSKL